MRPGFLLIIFTVIVVAGGWLNDWSAGWFAITIVCIALGFFTHRNLR